MVAQNNNNFPGLPVPGEEQATGRGGEAGQGGGGDGGVQETGTRPHLPGATPTNESGSDGLIINFELSGGPFLTDRLLPKPTDTTAAEIAYKTNEAIPGNSGAFSLSRVELYKLSELEEGSSKDDITATKLAQGEFKRSENENEMEPFSEEEEEGEEGSGENGAGEASSSRVGENARTLVARSENLLSFDSRVVSLPSDLGINEAIPLYLNMSWSYEDEPGWSLSGLFFSSDTTDADSAKQILNQREDVWQSHSEWWLSRQSIPSNLASKMPAAAASGRNLTEVPTPSITTSMLAGGGGDASATGGTTDATGAPDGAARAGNDGNDNESGGGGGGGGSGGGLSTAEIAGIAVGAGVGGLLIIGALIWFFCFYRKKRRGGGGGGRGSDHVKDGPYRSGESRDSWMANKEIGANVTESPHSPYSEDGGSLAREQHFRSQQQQQPSNLSHSQSASLDEGPFPSSAAATPGRNNNNRDGVPTMGTPVPPRSSTAGGGHYRGDSRSGAQSSMSANPDVSHLVEEGMTESEIRRLEEEERALDEAIALQRQR